MNQHLEVPRIPERKAGRISPVEIAHIPLFRP
jgi:hypothetical protein